VHMNNAKETERNKSIDIYYKGSSVRTYLLSKHSKKLKTRH
jgi:hypothetical protein